MIYLEAKKKIIVVKTEQSKKQTFDYFDSNPSRRGILIFIHLYFHETIRILFLTHDSLFFRN